MIVTTTIPANVTVIDVVAVLYGKLDMVYKFLSDNPAIESIDTDLTALIGEAVTYDTTLVDFTPAQLILEPPAPPENETRWVTVEGQSLYDICLQTYGDLNLIYTLLQENNIVSINAVPKNGQQFTFDSRKITNAAVFDFNRNFNVVYSTGETTKRRGLAFIVVSGFAYDLSFTIAFDS